MSSSKPKVFSPFNLPPIKSVTFSELEPIYELVIEDGLEVRKQKGEINLQDKLNEGLSLTSLDAFLQRVARGEASLDPEQNGGVYGDFSANQTRIEDVSGVVKAGRESFGKLSPRLKKAFGDSFENFVSGEVVEPSFLVDEKPEPVVIPVKEVPNGAENK